MGSLTTDPHNGMPRKTTARPKAQTVDVGSLAEGTRFRLPDSGRVGRVLRPPTASSAYCRIFRFDDEPGDRYDDLTIGLSTQVVPITLEALVASDASAAPAAPAGPAPSDDSER